MLETILLIAVVVGSFYLGDILSDLAISIEKKIKGI